MKLYTHPVSTACRPVMQFIADNDIPCEMEVVDILKGQHYEPAYGEKNPNRLVPMLEDGDFRLTESAAILRYLAEKIDSPTYPRDLKLRARVNEAMDWFNSNFYRDWGYGLVYPQLFPHHKRPDEKAHAGTISWAQERCKGWLQVLNDHWLAGGKKYLCGRPDHHRGLSRLGNHERRRADPLRFENLSQCSALVRHREEAAELREGEQGFQHIPRLDRGKGLGDGLTQGT